MIASAIGCCGVPRSRCIPVWRPLLLLALGACAVGACQRAKLGETTAHATVTPKALDFGSSPLLFPVRRSVLVSDGGNARLHFLGLRLEGADADRFAALAQPGPIEAGAALEVPVVFTPARAGPAAATLIVSTDDPEVPELSVALTGVGTAAGALSISPGTLDFGRVGEGQTETRDLELRSSGQADLYLGGLSFSAQTPPAFGLVGSVQTPATLALGASARVAVRFSPAPETAAGEGILGIDSSDPTHPHLEVPLHASINRAPLAVALGSVGGDPLSPGPITTAVGAPVDLDGSGSHDLDGDLPLSLRWSVSLRPEGSAAAVLPATAARARVTLDQPGLYSLQLSAQDSTGLFSLVPARLDLRAVPPEQLLVELVWDKLEPDLDLHLLQAGASPGGAGDCNFANPDPQWEPGGPDKNPHHLGDKLTGYGPETVRWMTPAAGEYTVTVIYKQSHGLADPHVTGRVRVHAFGVQVAELVKLLSAPGEQWNAGTISWPTGRVHAAPGTQLAVQR